MATTKKTTTNDSGEGIRVSDADSELLASLQSAAKSVAAVVAQGKTVVKALERFDAPKSLDRQDYLADALDALRGVDLSAYGCGALQGVIAESIEQRLRTLRATAHHELLTGLRDGVEKAEHLRVLSDSPLVVYVHPLTVELLIEQKKAVWTYAHETLQTVPLAVEEILAAHRTLVDAFRASRVDSQTFWTLLRKAYEMVLILDGLSAGSRIDIVEMLPALAWIWPQQAAVKKAGVFPRYLLAYQLQKLRADGLLQNQGLRMELGSATGGSTRNKQNVLFIPQGPSEGQYYLSICFRQA